MIGKLKGVIDSFGEDWTIIDVGGVGYVVHCSSKTLGALPGPGEAAEIAIETYVREDQIRLFGFATAAERDWFRLLLNVQGVGTKVALAILSTLGPSELASAVSLQDKASVARSPGVGPKVAQRIVSELRDKVPAFAAVAAVPGGDPDGTVAAAAGGSAAADAVSALSNLGYAQAQAGAAVMTAVRQLGEDAGAEELIRAALKELAR